MKRLLLAAVLVLGGAQAAFAQPQSSRLQIGGHLSQRSASNLGSDTVNSQLGLGGFASFRLFPGVYADGALSLFSSAVPVSTTIDAGRLTQLLVGGKFGARTGGFGFFGKFRAGIESRSRVTFGSYPSVQNGRADFLALDFGGVVEGYVGSHVLLRFDGGDVYTAAGYLANARHSLNLTFGAGWRF